MANKDRNKRSGRKARAEERARVEAAQGLVTSGDSDSKPAAKVQTKAVAKPKRFAGIRRYFRAVRSEMKKVVWPSREELRTYSLTVIGMLVVFGIAIWLIDTGVTAALVAFAGLRNLI